MHAQPRVHFSATIVWAQNILVKNGGTQSPHSKLCGRWLEYQPPHVEEIVYEIGMRSPQGEQKPIMPRLVCTCILKCRAREPAFREPGLASDATQE